MDRLSYLRETYRRIHAHNSFYEQLVLGIGLFITSLIVNVGANIYASQRPQNVVNDLILDFLPVVNLDFIYLQGAIALILVTIFLGFYRPQRLPFLLKTIGLFILIRSFFITLTHLSLPLPGLEVATYAPLGGLTRFLSSGNDLFFSGHTGFPFLLALIFWRDRLLRFLFLGASLIFGAAMLLAHVHYSIDVFAAFFITYAVYDLSLWLFTKDHKLFHLFPKQKRPLHRLGETT